jgi:hypothetical protein
LAPVGGRGYLGAGAVLNYGGGGAAPAPAAAAAAPAGASITVNTAASSAVNTGDDRHGDDLAPSRNSTAPNPVRAPAPVDTPDGVNLGNSTGLQATLNSTRNTSNGRCVVELQRTAHHAGWRVPQHFRGDAVVGCLDVETSRRQQTRQDRFVSWGVTDSEYLKDARLA